MRTVRTAIACLAVLGVSASSGLAQSVEPLVPSGTIPIVAEHLPAPPGISGQDAAERLAELKRWMEEFTDWIEWSEQWANRRERGWFTGFRHRREKPAPPAWLAHRCEMGLDDDEPLTSACALLLKWKEDPTAERRLAQVAARAPKEDGWKTLWWEHVHVDLLWPAMQGNVSTYSVIGTHTATSVRGRFQVFLAPGAMLLNVPARNGARVWKFAANYGIGYRLLEFAFPGGRPMVLHVNLAKAWLVSDIADVATGRSMDFVGFSLTFKGSR